MDNLFISLDAQCKRAGTNLTRMCHKAGISRSTITRWRSQEPKTVRLYRKLIATIEAEAAANQKQQANTEDD